MLALFPTIKMRLFYINTIRNYTDGFLNAETHAVSGRSAVPVILIAPELRTHFECTDA